MPGTSTITRGKTSVFFLSYGKLAMNTLLRAFSFTSLFAIAIQSSAEQSERPNILWLTFEDSSAYELSIYGNRFITNPNLEALAENGLVFQNASSNAPHCSPARSSLISGSYATSYGSDHHRAKVSAPKDRAYFPQFLKQEGYFTSNNKKRDYNVGLNNKALKDIWHESGENASYNSPARKSAQPFFAVFNFAGTHMSRLTSYTIKGRRNFTKSAGVAAAARPTYLPNLKAVQSDYQFHLEGVVDMDTWVGQFVEDLKNRGLYDNTIIFVFSDHGGSSPQGKGYLNESRSLRVPLIVHVPEQYRHLIPANSDNDVRSLRHKMVSFIDFGPTVLSLAGIATPESMQGQAFLGKLADHNRPYNYSFRSNQGKHYDPLRGITDGQYSYVKTYLKRKPIMLRNDFQWGMPANIALDDYAKTKKGKQFKQYYYGSKQGEYLYNLNTDKFEEHNIANDPDYRDKLQELRRALKNHIRNTRDLGFIPLAFKEYKPFEEWTKPGFNLAELQDLAETVSTVKRSDLDELKKQLVSEHGAMRFWAAQGFAELASNGQLKEIPRVLLRAAAENLPAIAAVALEALVYLEYPEALEWLLENKSNDHRRSALETLAYQRPDQLLSHKKALKEQLDDTTWRVIQQALGLRKARSVVTEQQKEEGFEVNLARRELIPLP